MEYTFVNFATSFTVPVSPGEAYRDTVVRQLRRASERAQYRLHQHMGDVASCIRLRARHAHLRLAGPKGKLP